MEKLSLRKYAAIIGVSHTAVAKAVKSGHINKGWDRDTKKIIADIANKEWGNSIREKNVSQGKEARVKTTSENFSETHLTEQDYTPTSEEMSLSEARRRKEIYNAEIARIGALKEQSLYVEKEKVYKQLFDFGQTIRVALQAIPDRLTDEILAAKTRFDAHSILLNAINDALHSLAAPPTIE